MTAPMKPSATVKIAYILTNDEKFETDINIYTYTPKSIAITCTEHFGKAFSEELKTIASYNPKLSIGKGWVLSNLKYPTLQTLIGHITEGKVKGVVPPEIRRKSVVLLPPIIEPPIVNSFKTIISSLNEIKDGKTVFVNNEHTYIWGKKDSVYAAVLEMTKTVIMEFVSGDNVIVVC